MSNYVQFEVRKVFTTIEEMKAEYNPGCHFFPYRAMEAGQTFHDGYGWLKMDFTAEQPGLLFQVANRRNNFVEYVFVLDGMRYYPNVKPDSFLFWK